MKITKEDINNFDININIEYAKLKKYIYIFFAIAIFVLPVVPEVFDMGIYSLKNTLFNLITIFSAIFLLFIDIKEKSFKINVYDIILLIYLLLVTLSCVFTKFSIFNCFLGTDGRGEGLLTIFSYIMTFIIACKGIEYIKPTIKVGIICAIIVAIYGMIQVNMPESIQLPFEFLNHKEAAKATMGNQNFLSSYICIFLPMVCYLFINTKGYKSIVACIMLFIALIYSSTLGGYLAFFAMSVIIIIGSFIYSKTRIQTLKRTAILILCFALIFTGITLLNGNSYVKEITSTKEEVANLANKEDDFATNRLAIWKKSLMVIKNNKLFGTGPDALEMELDRDIYMTADEEDILKKVRIDKAHSEYLHIAATTGVPSFIVYFVLQMLVMIRLLIVVVKKNNRLIKSSSEEGKENGKDRIFTTMVFLSLVSYIGQALGNISVVQVAPIFWLMFGMGAGLTLENRKRCKIK